MKDLEKRCKKAPDDLKPKLKAFLEDSHKALDVLSDGLHHVDKQTKMVAEYFCEDPKKFKIENLFSELLMFVRTFEGAVEVREGGREGEGEGERERERERERETEGEGER